MKKTIISSLTVLLALMTCACDQEQPIDTDQYPQSVYIVGAHDRIITRELHLGYDQDTLNLSVAISGSRSLSHDVDVTIAECPEAIYNYDSREISPEYRQYRPLDQSIYTIPSNTVTVKKGQVYQTMPIYISPSTLQLDSLYMLAFRIASTSSYEATKTDTVCLVNLKQVNDYSGQYYMNGVIKNVDNPNDSMVYVMPRYLTAVRDGRTVRMYHYRNEWSDGYASDYRPDWTFTISVNSDNSLTLTPVQNFKIESGGGTYYPEMKAYYLDYTASYEGRRWRTRGFLYKERKTASETHAITDWMEDMRHKQGF